MKRGIALVEVLVAMGLMAIILPALLTAFYASRGGRVETSERLSGEASLRQIEEGLRVVRDSGWDKLAVLSEGTPYHLIQNGSNWEVAQGEETVDPAFGLKRSFTIAPSYRDASGNLVDTSGTLDPSVKKIVVTANWGLGLTASSESEFYLMRLENLTWTETALTEFEAGVHSGTAAVDLSGGDIVLGQTGGAGDWCRPNEYIVAELDLPQSGAARDVKGLEGQAFTGTNQSGSGSFVEVGISPADPPTASIVSQISGYQTNDVFIDGGYAYVATGEVSKDVVIIDLATDQEVGYFNDTAWFGTAQGIYVVGNVGYVTIGLNLHTFDLSSKTGARPELDRVFLWGTGYRLQVVGDYAYIAVDWGSSELRLVNVANPSNIKLAAKANVNGSRGQEVYVNATGTRAYLATSASSDKDEFFIINTDVTATNKNNSSYNMTVLNSYDTAGMSPTGVAVVSGPRAILVGTGGQEYQVLDLTNETAPLQKCGGMDVDSGIYGVSSVFTSSEIAYSYIVTGDASDEFKIIEGGPGGGNQYLLTGEYTSHPFDTVAESGSQASAFNRLEADVVNPASVTSIKLQVAVADAVSSSCESSTYQFVGPDGTSSTYYELSGLPEGVFSGTIEGTYPWNDDGAGYENPGQCMEYKVYFATTDPALTPIFEEIRVNYSP